MDAATLQETNRIRVSLGMKPLPVPGAEPQLQPAQEASDSEEVASTLESRQAQAYDNFKQAREAEELKKRREDKKAAAKKARDAAQRFAQLEGKGLGEVADGGDVDAKAWLKSQKKRQKQIDKTRKLEEELAAAEAEATAAIQHTSKDLAGVKVGHDMENFLEGDEQILTLKDTTIEENEEEGDELENLGLREREKLEQKLDLKKNKPAYNPHDIEENGERSILAQYDEEIYGQKGKKFALDIDGVLAEVSGVADGSAEKPNKLQSITLDILRKYCVPRSALVSVLTPPHTEEAPSSDYIDISELKVKKPRKKKTKTTRQKPVDDHDIFPVASLEDDDFAPSNRKRKLVDESFVDDEDLQASLAIQRRDALKKRKKTRPEDIARQLKEESDQREPEDGDPTTAGVVIDEISEFVAGLRKPDDEDDVKPKKSKPAPEVSVTAMDAEEDHPMHDDDMEDYGVPAFETATSEEMTTTGVDEEKTISGGMGATLQLLKERGLVEDANGDVLNEEFRRRQEFLASRKRLEAEEEEFARQQRERERKSGRLDRMSQREREEFAQQQNKYRDQQFSRKMAQLIQSNYKPNVDIKYTDEFGRRLDQKEAFKHLSHQFHGKGSGKGKTDKLLKKIESEKRRESQSMLDASQNAGMSAATAHQHKKRKEAGVRLG
jgi:U4/U6.U5 tri-snRNP-associated protein 1